MTTKENVYKTPADSEPVRILWPTLFTPEAYKEDGKEKGDPVYSVTFLLTPEQATHFKKAAAAAAKTSDKLKNEEFSDIKFPFKSGDTIAKKREAAGKDGSIYKGMIVLRAKAFPDRFDPELNVVAIKDGHLVVAESKDIYSGCYVHTQVSFGGNNFGGTPRVSCYLQAIVKVKDGERIGGMDAKSMFAGYAGQTTDEDPTEGYEEGDDDLDAMMNG